MATRLEPFFKSYIDAWAPAQAKGRAELAEIFIEHYGEVVGAFASHEAKSLKLRAEAVTLAQADGLIRRARAEASGLLTRLDALIEAEPAQKDLSSRVKRKFKALMCRRIPFIANFNTNGVAEETRLLIASKGGAFTATWVTRMDERVRAAHREAHGQVRDMGTPYDVGGEQLRFPGDMSLGASLGNVINCRCKLVFYLDGRPIDETPSLDPVTAESKKPIPTTAISLANNARARVVLRDGSRATVIREGQRVRVVRDRQTVARAKIGLASLRDITVTIDDTELGIEALLRNTTPL